jgi:hypothetical protein
LFHERNVEEVASKLTLLELADVTSRPLKKSADWTALIARAYR